MLRANLKKIKSAPRPLLFLLGVGVVIFVLQMSSFLPWTGHRNSDSVAGYTERAVYHLQTGGRTYDLEAVTKPTSQEQGLGSRTQMPASQGMLFAYPTEDDRCFWMKDMRFSLDIIWLDASKRITRLEQNLSPATYPQAFCAHAQYIIELNGGESAKSRLQTGNVLNF